MGAGVVVEEGEALVAAVMVLLLEALLGVIPANFSSQKNSSFPVFSSFSLRQSLSQELCRPFIFLTLLICFTFMSRTTIKPA